MDAPAGAHPLLQILAHRGMHGERVAPNSLQAFEQALSSGFGIEVDVRDEGGQLMVAHDPHEKSAYPFAQLGALLARFPNATAAINIKSCGLQPLLKSALAQTGLSRYFTFDMALPDLLRNVREGVTSFTRQSEYELAPSLYEETQGVWLDMFEIDWIDAATLSRHVAANKSVAIVSPELHRRAYEPFWNKLKAALSAISLPADAKLYLCTDVPHAAERYFHA